MKNIFKRIILPFAAAAALVSCSGLLDTTPYDFVAPETFYTTEMNCTMALAGVYNAMNTQEFYGNYYSCMLSNTDDLSYYQRAAANTASKVFGNDHGPSDGNILDAWTAIYSGINNANMFIENIDGAEIPDALKIRMKGEARFLRAYYHFILVQGWYDVPLRKESFKDVNLSSLEATPHEDAIDWIISEMEECVSMVDDSEFDKSPSYVKKNTVMGILARVYLWRAGFPINGGSEDYAKAAEWARKVKDSGKHQLNPDYEAIFKNLCGDKYDEVYNESIWEAEFKGSRDDGIWTMGRIGNTLGNLDSRAVPTSSGFYAGSLILWDLYDAKDIRRDVTMAPYSINKNGVQTAWNAAQIIQRTCGKFRREWEPETSTNKNWTPENFPILRYSDVLLMIAEGENESKGGPTSLAYECLNLVRGRAQVGDAAPGMDQEAFRQAVRDERGRELAFEALRKYDLIRWGIYVSTIRDDLGAATKDKRWTNGTDPANKFGGAAVFAQRTADKHQFLPIPERELSVNTLLKQNKYWSSASSE